MSVSFYDLGPEGAHPSASRFERIVTNRSRWVRKKHLCTIRGGSFGYAFCMFVCRCVNRRKRPHVSRSDTWLCSMVLVSLIVYIQYIKLYILIFTCISIYVCIYPWIGDRWLVEKCATVANWWRSIQIYNMYVSVWIYYSILYTIYICKDGEREKMSRKNGSFCASIHAVAANVCSKQTGHRKYVYSVCRKKKSLPATALRASVHLWNKI